MFKILIVDDEKGHRSALAKMLYVIYPEDMFLEAESGNIRQYQKLCLRMDMQAILSCLYG